MTFSRNSPFSAFSQPTRFDLQIRQKKHLYRSNYEFSYSSEDDDWSIFEGPSMRTATVSTTVVYAKQEADILSATVAAVPVSATVANNPSTLKTRLTPKNVKQYIGYEIIFKSGGKEVKRRIKRASESGKSITVDYPDLQNTLNLTRKIHVILSVCRNISSGMVIAPISKAYKSKKQRQVGDCSKTNYEREKNQAMASPHSNWSWDDGPSNKAQVGDYFAFLFFEKEVILHKIKEIDVPKTRPIEWQKNERNVLRLTPPIITLPWETWILCGGGKKTQGTYSVSFENEDLRKKKLLSHIQTNFNNI